MSVVCETVQERFPLPGERGSQEACSGARRAYGGTEVRISSVQTTTSRSTLRSGPSACRRRQWGDRIPHIVQQPDGTECWMVDGEKLPMRGVASAGAAMTDRAREPQRWEEVPRVAYDPRERLTGDGCGRRGCPACSIPLSRDWRGKPSDASPIPELELACVQAYNDWLIEEWAEREPTLYPAVHCAAGADRGHGAGDPARRQEGPQRGHLSCHPDAPARCAAHQRAGIRSHCGRPARISPCPCVSTRAPAHAIQFPAYKDLSPGWPRRSGALTRPVSSVQVVANFLYSRILMRFPALKVVFAESSLAWGAYELETADHQFERQRLHLEGYDMKPSEMFHRQCYMTGWYDRVSY